MDENPYESPRAVGYHRPRQQIKDGSFSMERVVLLTMAVIGGAVVLAVIIGAIKGLGLPDQP